MNQNDNLNAFVRWVKSKPKTNMGFLPLTHVTKAIRLEKILSGEITLETKNCPVFEEDLLYTFYGRVGYRVTGDGVIKNEALSPVCFVMNGELIKHAYDVFPFDTGAYEKRMYKHHFGDDLDKEDYSIKGDVELPNQLIQCLYGTLSKYFDGDARVVPARQDVAKTSEMSAGLYIDLVKSEGRNEPDDRVGSIEVLLSKNVELKNSLKCIILPDAFKKTDDDGDWLRTLRDLGCEIRYYAFVPGKGPEHYHAHLESELRKYFTDHGHILDVSNDP